MAIEGLVRGTEDCDGREHRRPHGGTGRRCEMERLIGRSGELPIEGQFPSLGGATEWLNSPPLDAEGLRGKVVVVDFCTYTCINWLRSLPYVRAWAKAYEDRTSDTMSAASAFKPEVVSVSGQASPKHKHRADMRVESLADHLDLVPLIGRWHWTEFGRWSPGSSPESWTSRLARGSRRNGIPTTFVAFVDEEPVGSALLLEHNMITHHDLTPWLAGLYVLPAYRGQGIGTALVHHSEEQSARMEILRLYLYTPSENRFYERLGWSTISRELYVGQAVAIMAKDLRPPSSPARSSSSVDTIGPITDPAASS
jgi:GNAT superfamily N-acetyltransferase